MTVNNSGSSSNSGGGATITARPEEAAIVQHQHQHPDEEEEEELQQQQLIMQHVVDMSTADEEVDAGNTAAVDTTANSLHVDGLVHHHQHHGGGGQQVVMMTTANGEQHHVVISEDGQLLNGHVMVQGGQETFVIHTTGGGAKVEPEDLSFGSGGSSNGPHGGDEVIRTTTTSSHHHIDLEAGAQAIQASAATAVQNVLRSLKDPDKSILNQILPPHLLADVMTTTNAVLPGTVRQQHQSGGGNGVVVTTGGINHVSVLDDPLIGRPDTGLDDFTDAAAGGALSSPTYTTSSHRRSRGSQESSSTTSSTPQQMRMQIAKQYSPWGFHYTLEAATAQWVRKEEDRCTYLNKGQFYGVTLEYRPGPTENLLAHLTEVKSVVVLVFRDAKNPEDELNAWAFWHQRQPTNKQRIIDAETNNISEDCGIARIEDLAYNAIAVYWSPLQKPAFISLAIQCLSTDFSLQKGVKGLPMHLQIDTYVRSSDGVEFDDLVHRGYCQVKVFCDKGAERKFRQEERRAARKVAAGGQRVLEMYHQCQERSEFYAMVDMSRDPVLYTPSAITAAAAGMLTPPPPANFLSTGGGGNSPGNVFPTAALPSGNSSGQSLLKQNGGGVISDFKRRKTQPPPDTRMVVYVRQENEEIYTPLHLVPPTVPGLARAIESKYNVSATAIRYLYRRNRKGITAKLDDDLLKYYCNEDTFLMQVTAIELEGLEGHESIMYDITLCEIGD